MIRTSKAATDRLPYDTEPMAEEGIDLVAVVVAVLAEWKIALITFVVAAAVGLAYVNALKPQYVASATFLPSQGRTEISSVSDIFNSTGPGTLYLGLMRSRSVLDDVIVHAHLMQAFGTGDWEFARFLLSVKSSFSQAPDGIITVTVRDENAQQAATIANAYLTALQDLSDNMAQAQARQAQRYLDAQLQTARERLATAEQALIALKERTGQVAPASQLTQSIGNIAGYRGQIAQLRVQLQTLRESEAEDNPDIQRVKAQIAGLEREEAVQEVGQGPTPVGASISASRLPYLERELSKAQDDVTAQQAAVNGLTAQYGSARSESNLTHPAFQVIDTALPPEFRAWPPHDAYVTAAVGFAAVAALVIVLLVLIGKRIWKNPQHRASLGRLRRAL